MKETMIPLEVFPLRMQFRGTWVAQLAEHLPLAQVMVPGPWMKPCIGLPASPSLFAPLPCSLCQINK